MTRKELIDIILEGQEVFARKKPLKRDITFDHALALELHKVITISGVRRSGKTMYLKQIAQELDVSDDAAVFIDFSESSLSQWTVHDFEQLPVIFFELYPGLEPVFFLDEIQEVGDFERGLRYLQNKLYPIFVTGSSAQLFSRDIASRLRGKSIEITVSPLNLKEFLRFKQFPLKRGYVPSEKARLRRLTEEYLTWGGFPEVVLSESIESKKLLLGSYLDTMLLRDVIEKNPVGNVQLMRRLLSRVITSFTKHISIHKWYHDFKSMGFKVSKDTLYRYLGYLTETGFFSLVNAYGKEGGSRQKIYLVDNGLYAVRRGLHTDRGKLLENAVYTCLRQGAAPPVYFNTGSAEVDFITETALVQVCDTVDPDTIGRELQGFTAFGQQYGDRLARVLVYIDSDGEDHEGMVPVYDFLAGT